MNVLALKLTTNEDVMGEIESESETEYVVLNPLSIAVVPTPQGQPNIGFVPFPIHSEQKVDRTICIAKKNVVYSYEPAQNYVENYKRIFGSGIITPQKQLII
jgi:hypothetical protein